MIPIDMISGFTNETNDGPIEVIMYKSCKEVLIRFVNTGYERKYSTWSIRSGSVKDMIKPSVFGVGYIGSGNHKAHERGKRTKAYKIWIGILERCYNPKGKSYKYYGGAGVSVCDDWHNFQNFAEWFYERHKDGLEVDKDLKCSGSGNIYSPEFCVMFTRKENNDIAHAKTYELLSPSGELTKIHNLNEFCLSRGLDSGHMSKVFYGQRMSHKGWTKAPE